MFLDEDVTTSALAGLALILGGTALATGCDAHPSRVASTCVNRYWTLLLILASVWGASYLFIKVAVEGGLEPAPMMCARAAIAAAVLLAYVFRSLGRDRALAELSGSWRQWVVIGAVANALPFWLVAWGEKHVDSGIAAIAQSTVPLFTILLGLRFLPHEPLSRGAVARVHARPRRCRRPRRRPSRGWLVGRRRDARGRVVVACVRVLEA